MEPQPEKRGFVYGVKQGAKRTFFTTITIGSFLAFILIEAGKALIGFLTLQFLQRMWNRWQERRKKKNDLK